MAARKKKKSLQEVQQDKFQRMMLTVAKRASFYRNNPQRLCADYLNIQLKLFQKITLYEMFHSTNFAFVGMRAIGKTFLTAVYIVCRCILYPGTKVVIVAGTKNQAVQTIVKVDTELMNNFGWGSANLRNEIKYISTSTNNPVIRFKNGSNVVTATASDNSRGLRAHVLVVDENRLVPEDIVNSVLVDFTNINRMPPYLSLPQYKDREDLQERNTEVYLTSAYYKQNWSYKLVQDYFQNMLRDDMNFFTCSLNYQLAIKEGMRSRAQIRERMAKSDFNETIWKMENEALFVGNEEDALFKYDDLSSRRKIKNAFYPLAIYKKHNIAIPPLEGDGERILAVDIALMASKRHNNDASAITIADYLPNGETYSFNVMYEETHEGLTTDNLGLLIMRYFYQYHCTQLVIDCQGNGLGVYDFLVKNQYDPEYGITYSALTCCNNQDMADRCHVKGAKALIWAIKANEAFNSQTALSLRSGFANGYINLPAFEYDVEDNMEKIRGYKSMTPVEKASLMTAYAQTTMMVNEIINLHSWVTNGNTVHVKEASGSRKDRYSSIEYAYWCCQQLEIARTPIDYEDTQKLIDKLSSRIKIAKIH